MSLFTTVLYMPFISFFAIIMSCANGNLSFPGCPTEPRFILISSATILSFLFAVISLIVAASFYESDSSTDDVSARPHSRVELFYLVLKGVITV